MPSLSSTIPLRLEILYNTDLVDDIRDVTVGRISMPSLLKRKSITGVH
jgi:hypothetical protein